MKAIPLIVMILAGTAIAGCSTPLGRTEPPVRGRTILDAGTPPPSVGQGPQLRHAGESQDSRKEGRKS